METLVNQDRLSEILRKKGIGPEGSKSLKPNELEEVRFLFAQQDVSLTTKATLLTALLTLEPNNYEGSFIEELKNGGAEFLPIELNSFVSGQSKNTFEKGIFKAISNTDLNEAECESAMASFFDPAEPDYLKASFLEAERLKRETFLENKSFFNALWNQVEHTQVDLPILIDIADSYDGCNRTKHFSVFVASLLASAGFPTYLTGIEKVAPKEAITSHQILKAAGKNPLMQRHSVIEDLKNPEIGWGYLDQKEFFPALYSLRDMRKEMVKRPFLATFEKLLQPIQSFNKNLLVTGYTHTHYREELVKQLQEQNQCKEAIVLKGVEGSTQVAMSRDTVVVHYNGSSIMDGTINPQEFELPVYNVSRDMAITPEVSLQEGIAALKGESGFSKDNIIYTAAIILSKFKLVEKHNIIPKLNSLMHSGAAFNHWEKGCNK